MNDQDFQHLDEVVQGITMNPDFKAHLEEQLREAYTAQHRQTRVNRRWLSLVAVLAVCLIVSLSPLPVIAQQFFEIFFTRLPDDSIITTTPETPVTSTVWFTASSIAEAEAALGIALKTLTVPASYALERVSYRPAPLQITAVYSRPGRTLIFSQGETGWVTQTSVGASATITSIEVRGVEGEYVEGFWIEDGAKIHWHNGSAFRRIRWQESEMQYEIFAVGGSEDTDDLDVIALAENMR
jgi:hypothetical protein